MTFDPWIVICTNEKIGAPWAFADCDDLRVNLRACGWSDEDVDALLDDEQPGIYDAWLLRVDTDANEADYTAFGSGIYRVYATGEAEYIRDI